MHTLVTTPAYVLSSYPQGESSLVYKLFTKDRGVLYAHGRSVRELRNRNRYALQVGYKPTVTLVRGRETWRITTAQHNGSVRIATEHSSAVRKVLHLLGRYLPVEDVVSGVFEDVEHFAEALCLHKEYAHLIEAIVVLRILDRLGYVARPLEEQVIVPFLETHAFDRSTLERGEPHKAVLIERVNAALGEAK